MAVQTDVVQTILRTGDAITVKELMSLPDDGNKYERVKGVLKVTPAGHEQEYFGIWLATLLTNYVRSRKLGQVYGSNAGYRLPNGDVRAPDVSFVRQERIPGGRPPKGFAEYAPDLAVEVLSPNQQLQDLGEKVGEFLDWGTPLVWVLDPEAQSVTVYRSLTEVYTLGSEDELSGEEVIPGFSVRVAELFE
ncbi:MAG: Uma2 family endonuclease [Candidatus Methylomirabilales bacterium]